MRRRASSRRPQSLFVKKCECLMGNIIPIIGDVLAALAAHLIPSAAHLQRPCCLSIAAPSSEPRSGLEREWDRLFLLRRQQSRMAARPQRSRSSCLRQVSEDSAPTHPSRAIDDGSSTEVVRSQSVQGRACGRGGTLTSQGSRDVSRQKRSLVHRDDVEESELAHARRPRKRAQKGRGEVRVAPVIGSNV